MDDCVESNLGKGTLPAAVLPLRVTHDIERLPANRPVSGAKMAELTRRSIGAPCAEPNSLMGLPQFAQLSAVIGPLLTEAQRLHRTFALVCFDLDGFRLICETFGQAQGDAVLQRVAAIVKTRARPNAIVSRHGTDGFIVALTDSASAAGTAGCVQQILDEIAAPFVIGEEILRITASAGIALFPRDGTDVDTLSRNARCAARESKARCPGALRFHSGNVTVLAKRRLRLEMDLCRAIENHELTLLFQPQFNVADGRACGVEALARWTKHDGTQVEPRIFIPLAEKSQMIRALGAWVVNEACQVVSRQTQGLEPVTLCVNVSPHQINRTFAKDLQRILKHTGFPAERLELEITENALISNTHSIIECFRQLKAMGIRIAIDDFGTGYSSLHYLSRLPVDRLKLDKSLVHNLPTRWKDVAIVRAIVELGRELGIAVIAEGVETEQQFQVLKSLGCLQVQGYLLARPTSQQEAFSMIERRWGSRIIRSTSMPWKPEITNAS
jgi:diguanylate cyclase (GGDEF)-like protein